MADFPERLMALQPFWGVWVLDSSIGEGSYGKVFRIRREELGTTTYAALKWITLPKSQSELIEYRSEGLKEDEVRQLYRDNIRRFREEIDMMNRLKGNSHIVNYEDHMILERNAEIGWDILIRMELLKPLSSRYQEGMKVGDVVKLGLDLCDALVLCAKAHIIHRDIKTDNIFISSFQEYKLGDFGVARNLEKSATHLSRQGTPVYMAPEVYLGKGKYDASVDIYSLGLVMHRLLNRQRMPFLPMDDLVPTHEQRNLALETRLQGIPIPRPIDGGTELGKVICKACAYDPKKRYRSAEEMRTDLLKAAEKTDRNKRLTTNPTGAGLNSKRSSLPLKKAGQTDNKNVGKKKTQNRRVLWAWIILAAAAVLFAAVFSVSLLTHSTSEPGTVKTEPIVSVIALTPTSPPVTTATPVATATQSQVPSATGKPDLAVEMMDYTPNTVTVGQTVAFHLRISNQGKGDADGFKIKMYVNGEQKDYRNRAGLVASDKVPYSNETFEWKPARAGVYSVVFAVAEEQTVQESDESNNETSISIEVKDAVTATPTPTKTPAPTVAGKPDLAVEMMDYTPGAVTVGQTVAFHLRISNQGKGDADGFKIKMYVNGEQKDYRNCAGLVASDKVPYSNETFEWKPARAGVYSVVFVVAEEQTVQESDESNNETSISIEVKDAVTATPTPTDTPAPTVAQSVSSVDTEKSDAEGKTKYPVTYQDPVTGDTVATLSVKGDLIVVSLYVPTMPDTFTINKAATKMNAAEYAYEVAFKAGGKEYRVASTHFKLSDEKRECEFKDLQHNLWEKTATGSKHSVMDVEASVSSEGWITWAIPNENGTIDTDHIRILSTTVYD